MEKKKTINMKVIEDTFKNLDNQELSVLGGKLVKELKFMEQSLTKLKKEIKEHGVVVSMCQGKYNIERSNPAIASYNTMVKNYNSTIKQMYDLLNYSGAKAKDIDFEDDDLSD